MVDSMALLRHEPSSKSEAAGGFSPEVVRGGAGLFELLEDWKALFSRAKTPQVFFHPAWVLSWLEVLHNRGEPVTLVIRGPDGSLAGILPMFEVPAIGGRGLWPMGAHSADRFEPLLAGSEPALLRAFWSGLEGLLEDHVFAWLPLVPAAFLEASDETYRSDGRMRRKIRPRVPHQYWEREAGVGFDAFLSAAMRKKSRKGLERQRRQLAEKGDLRWEHHREPEAVARFLPELQSLEAASWKGGAGVGLFSNPAVARFYRLLLPRLAAEGLVELSCLRVGEISVAYELALLAGRCRLVHNMAFLPDFAAYSPGMQLLLRNFERVFAGPVGRVDFLQGGHAYKGRFANRQARLMDLSLFAGGWAGRLNGWTFRRLAGRRG